MSHRNTHKRSRLTPAEVMAQYLDDRNDELLDAVVTAAALVARADGRIEAAERGLLVDFLDRNGFLSIFTRNEILDAFERRVRELGEERGAETAVDSLGRLAGRSPARLVIGAGKHIAAANGRSHPVERHMLELIRHALGRGPAPTAPSLEGTGGAR
jgi:tellurite resistance protein